MTVLRKIENMLKGKSITFKEFHHRPVRTSEEADELRPDYTLSQGAKAIIISGKFAEDDRKYFMLVLPGDKRIHSKKVRKVIGCKSFSFATEAEVIDITKGVLPGGVPPFGNLFGLEVIVDSSLSENEEIIFNAGDRSVSIAMRYKDYEDLVDPKIVDISQ